MKLRWRWGSGGGGGEVLVEEEGELIEMHTQRCVKSVSARRIKMNKNVN